MEQEGEGVSRCTHKPWTAVNNPSSVGMVPVRSLVLRSLHTTSPRLVPTIVQRDTQGGGWQGAYNRSRLLINPSSVGMVPVR
jgi:hypothetical protein